MATRRRLLSGAVAVTLLTVPAGCGQDGDVTIVRSQSGTTTATGAPSVTVADPHATSPLPPSGATPSTAGPPIEPVTTDPVTTGPASTDPATPVDDPAVDPFGWTDRGDGLDEGHLDVPIDRADPGGGSFTLHLLRRPASNPSARVGTLLVNPGGPGAGGSFLVEAADSFYGDAILDAFDIVAWDPRGTGLTVPTVDCVDDIDPFVSLDSSPDTAEERQAILAAATAFGAGCVERSGTILPFLSTEATARDMDAIRSALGERTISYFGFSYGSEIGVTWASLFPTTVRAMVIDGAADQTVGYLQQNLEQAAGFEATFDTFLAECSASSACAFHNGGHAAAAFDVLNAAAEAAPRSSVRGRPVISQGVLTTAVADAMYSRSSWPVLDDALADLEDGDGRAILALYDDYYGRGDDGSYDNSLEAYFAINCLDDPGTKDVEALFEVQDDFAAAAPRLGAGWILELQFCAVWPVPAAPPVAVDAAGAGPVVVVGTTGDPATPLVSTRHMADALEDGRLVVVTADQHTGYGVNDCIDDAVETYLIRLVPPADGTSCG